MRVELLVCLTSIGLVSSRCHAEDEAQFERLVAETQVHSVTVSEPAHHGLAEDEILDWLGLVKGLRVETQPNACIRKLLPKLARDVLTDDAEKGKIAGVPDPLVPRMIKLRLGRELGAIIRNHILYDPGAFAKVELPKRVKELVELGDKRTTFQTQLMNRELLSVIFPKCIAPTPADFQTVRVTVKAGKPVVLVFSSYWQCRWVVTVEKGATVAGVMLFGTFAQEVSGTDAQVIYAAHELPDGKKAPQPGSHAWKQEGAEYARLHERMKAATGRDFTSFQGKYQSEKEPFVVTPGK